MARTGPIFQSSLQSQQQDSESDDDSYSEHMWKMLYIKYINFKFNNTTNNQLFCYIQHFSHMLTLNSNGVA